MGRRAGGGSTAGIVGVVGGLAAVVGSALVWFSVRADTSSLGGQVLTNSVKGTETSDGKVTLVAGLVVIGVGLAFALGWAARARKWLSALVILAGVVAGGAALYDMLTAKSQVIDAAVKEVGGTVGFGTGQIRGFLEQAFDTGILKITPGIGIMLVMGGGALALVAGVLGVTSRVEPAPVPAMPAEAREPVPGVPAPSPGDLPASPSTEPPTEATAAEAEETPGVAQDPEPEPPA